MKRFIVCFAFILLHACFRPLSADAAAGHAAGLEREAAMHRQKGEHVEAFRCYAEGLMAAIAEGDDRTVMRCAGNLSIIYHDFGDVENSLYFAHKGYEKAQRLGDKAQLTFLSNFVSFYSQAADTANAAKYYGMMREMMPLDNSVLNGYFLIYERARLERARGLYSRAAASHAEARKYAVDNGMPAVYVLFQDSEAGNIMVLQSDWEGALAMGRRCLAEAGRTGNRDIVINSYKMLADAYGGLGVRDSADRYIREYYSLKNKVYDMHGFFDVHNDIMRYKDSMAEGRISKLNALVLAGVGLSLALIGLLAALVGKNMTLRKAQRLLIEKNNELISAADNCRARRMAGSGGPDGRQQPAGAQDELLSRIISVFEDVQVISDPDFSLSMMAEKTNSNTKYVSTVINRTYGKNFKTLLSEYRIREACRRMAGTGYGHLTIKAIAGGVGFRNTVSFIRCFKNVMGMTPSVFLRLSKK